MPGAAGIQGPAGPAGANGLPGVAGAQGPQGPIGASDAFASSTSGAMRLGRSLRTVERLDLGAGAHVLLAKVALSQTARRSTRVVCTLRVGKLLAAEPAAPAAALLRCLHYSPPSARVFAANVQLTAIKVGALTAQ